MKQKTRRRISTVTRMITTIIVLLLLLGVVGFFAFFTNGFTGDFKTFYVVCGGETIMNDKTDYSLAAYLPHRFDVKYTFGFMQKNKNLGYHVKVVPCITNETKFDFTIDGKKYGYEGETDLTQGFNVEQYDEYFTISADKDLPDILAGLYSNKKVENVPQIIGVETAYFILIISSEDYGTELYISFWLDFPSFDLQLTPNEVIF